MNRHSDRIRKTLAHYHLLCTDLLRSPSTDEHQIKIWLDGKPSRRYTISNEEILHGSESAIFRFIAAAAKDYLGVHGPKRTIAKESWGISCDVALGLVQATAKALDAAAAVMPYGGPNTVGETVRRELFERTIGDLESLIESIREEIDEYNKDLK